MDININISAVKKVFDKSVVTTKICNYLTGVYVARDAKGSCLYVGKTVNLSSRMNGHRRTSKFFIDTDYVEFYALDSEYEKEIAETYLINALKPIYNISKAYFKQEEYDLILDDINAEIDELKSELVFDEFYIDEPCDSSIEDEYESRMVSYDKKLEQAEIDSKRQRLRELYRQKTHVSYFKSV